MIAGTFKKILFASVGAGAMLAGTSAAQAGAFAIREQSAQAQGEAFAGVAAGAGGSSSMFWNPATITKTPGWQSQWSLSGIIPYASINPVAPTPTAALGGSGNTSQAAIVPATYASYQWNDWLWLGLSQGAPYGLTTTSGPNWAGQVYGQTSHVSSYEITPTVGVRFNDWISVGAGLRILRFNTRLTSALATAPNAPGTELKGDAWNVGFSAGLTLTPIAGTELGIGYRSQVKESLNGTFTTAAAIPGLPAGSYGIKSSVTLPDQVTVGLRQRITDKFTLLGTYEWTHWGAFNRFPVCLKVNGVCPAALALAFRYRDGWFASVGGEYKWDQNLTLRAGLGYEYSPISDAVRGVRLPDNNRIWASIGAGYQITQKLAADVSYSHIFPKSTNVNITSAANPAFNGLPFVANVKSHVDIISVSLSYRWDDPKVIVADAPKGTIIRKY